MPKLFSVMISDFWIYFHEKGSEEIHACYPLAQTDYKTPIWETRSKIIFMHHIDWSCTNQYISLYAIYHMLLHATWNKAETWKEK